MPYSEDIVLWLEFDHDEVLASVCGLGLSGGLLGGVMHSVFIVY